MKKRTVPLVVAGLLLLAAPALAVNPMLLKQADAATPTASGEPVPLPENLQPAEIDAIVSRLNDDQVRRLLIAQLQAGAAESPADQTSPPAGGLGRVIHWLESGTALFVTGVSGLVAGLPSIPADLRGALGQLTGHRGLGRFGWMAVVVLGLLGVGFAAEKAFGRLTATFRRQIEAMPGMEGLFKIWGAVITLVPDLLGLLIFTLTPLILFFLTVDREDTGLRLLFLATLLTIVMLRLFAALLDLVLSMDTAKLRFVRLTDEGARHLHHRLVLAAGILVLGMVGAMLLERLGTPLTTLKWWMIVCGSTFISIFAGMVWHNRRSVREFLLKREEGADGTSRWLRRQFADMWHVLALAYLFLVWLLAIAHLVLADTVRFRGMFVISFLIVPIYLVLDRLALWCFESTLVKRRGDGSANGQTSAPHAGGGEAPEPAPAAGGYLVIARRAVRIVVFVAVALWFLDVWGFHVPVGETAVAAVFNILLTLFLAHLAWELISAAIARKLAQGGYIETAEKSDDEDEWGAGLAQDRSRTLLPMLRKFIGMIIVVMTTLVVLSALGVDIGPLLAGAGVVGLAIGFGAQKIVRDILSGIFFLMDDAFRVGEYLEAGGVSGTVEQITLRTIKLRHHRGMLQIVPLGDLNSVTNFMRGGIVVKFDLKLPYDTDIDKVRKIIKKVGKRMLLDEEFGPDFIKPLKSQGIRDVGDSVMTFRAKFTARPGRHFIIRREAYKFITEALEKEGIYYAHRKVIVDLAPGLADKMDIGPASTERAGEMRPDRMTPEQKRQVLTAGAAAALDTIIAGEQDGQKPRPA